MQEHCENLVTAINAAGGRLFNGGITIDDDGTNYNISGIGEVVIVSYSKGGSDTTFTKIVLMPINVSIRSTCLMVLRGLIT